MINLSDGDIIGWAIFNRSGGEVIEQVCERGIEIGVGPSLSNPQLRVRYSPADACDVDEEDRFLFSAAKQQLAQIRALVMCGALFSIRTDVYEVVVDRHPTCPHDLIDSGLHRLFAARQESWDLKHDRLAKRTYRLVKDLVQGVEERTRREVGEQLQLRERLVEVSDKVLEGTLSEYERMLIRRLAPGSPLNPDEFGRSLVTLVDRLDWDRLTGDQRLWLSSFGLEQGGTELIRDRFRYNESDLQRV